MGETEDILGNTSETPLQRFNRLYITSSEVGSFLAVPRATIVNGKISGKLPNPIEVPGINLTIWEREALLPHILKWKETLNKRRGLTKNDSVNDVEIPEPIIDAEMHESLIEGNQFDVDRAQYAKSTKVYSASIAPRIGSKTEALFNECAEMTRQGLFTGLKSTDKKIFMAKTKLPFCDASLSAGFYIWVRSGRPLQVE